MSISTTDTAKLVRQTLANTFGKATKFSVRSDYNSIRVNWTDGPTAAEVEHAIGHYCAGSFDSMTDSFDYDGSPYANRYIFTSRHESLAVWETVKDLLIAEYPQVITEGWFELCYGSYYEWRPEHRNHTSGIDWNRIYRRAVSSYDASTGQFIYTDIMYAYSTPDNWQHHENIAEVEPEPQPEPESVVYEPVVIHPIVVATPKRDIFIEGVKFPKLNKQNTLAEYQGQLGNPDDYNTEKVKVTKIVQLSPESWDTFSQNLLEGFDWLAGEGGSETYADLPADPQRWTDEQWTIYRTTCHTLAVAVRAENRPVIYANPEGYQYARYVGL